MSKLTIREILEILKSNGLVNTREDHTKAVKASEQIIINWSNK